jgi:DHA1 family bicyclomycin/chloramphenicol resistance-like MFS transporter
MLTILTGAELNLFTPSFPELKSVFSLSTFMVELVLTVNFVAYCGSSFIVGYLGDRYGKKNVIQWGLAIFIIGSILCTIANNFWCLLLGRLLQGMGVSAPAVLSFVIVTDYYPLNEQQHKIGLINGFVTIAMILAPILGGYISLLFNWRGNFVLLLLLGIISLILTMRFIPDSPTKVINKFSLREYTNIFTSSKFVFYYIIIICLISQSYWIFLGMAPILYIESLNVSLKHFGIYQGTLCLSFAIVSFLGGYLVNRFGQKQCLFFSIGLLALFLLLISYIMVFNINNPLILNLAIQLQGIAVVLPINVLWPIALNSMPEAKGKMASIVVGGRLIITSIGLQIVSYFYKGVFFHIGVAMIVSLIISLLAFYKLLQYITISDNNQVMITTNHINQVKLETT